MLNKKIKVFVLFNGYVRNLKDVALELDLFQSVTLKVVELGINECGKLYRQLIQYYHPDHNPGFPTECLQAFNWLNH